MKKKHISWSIWIIILIVTLFFISLFSLFVGSASITVKQIIAGLLKGGRGTEYSIVFSIRLPRILLGMSIGGSLSLAGVILQSLFRNPLVEPYTLGISGGAALGVCLNIVFGLNVIFGSISMFVFGFTGALCVIALIYTLSMRKGIINIQGVLLTGVMLSFISSSIIMLLMSVSRTEDIHKILFWIMGSLEEPDWIFIKLSLIFAFAGLLMSYMFCWRLNALSLGEEDALHLGI
ncbi:FecCD family ABC transporter permease, partial [Elusimicrobiota bacterium]